MENSEENWAHTTTNYQKVEEISIKEERIEENSQDRELYKNVLQSVKTEKCITDDDQIDKEHDNLINNDIRYNENTNSNGQNFEIVYIKEEPLKETFQDCESYENVLQSEEEDDGISEKTKSKNCAICNESFTRECDLRMHVRIHKGINEVACPICNKLFLRNGDVVDHIKTHCCSICGGIFKKEEELEVHMKLHTEIREYECPTCHKIFKRNSHLKAHVKIHSGVKEYKCTICNKQFSQGSSLTQHRKIHTGTYRCPICGILYRTNVGLKGHIEVHNKSIKNNSI